MTPNIRRHNALSELSLRYTSFDAAYTHATLGLVNLELEGTVIRPSGAIIGDDPCEAYDRLRGQADRREPEPSPAALAVHRRVAQSVRVCGDRFGYRVTTRDARECAAGFDAQSSSRFQLPGHWECPGFVYSEFVAVAKTLWTLSVVHCYAGLAAARSGCHALGMLNARILTSEKALARRVSEVAGLDVRFRWSGKCGSGASAVDTARLARRNRAESAHSWRHGAELHGAAEPHARPPQRLL